MHSSITTLVVSGCVHCVAKTFRGLLADKILKKYMVVKRRHKGISIKVGPFHLYKSVDMPSLDLVSSPDPCHQLQVSTTPLLLNRADTPLRVR